MAKNSKRGFLSSLFENNKQKEEQETAELESRHRLEERIQQILAEKVEVPQLFVEENQTALVIQEAEPEPEVKLLPISASALSRKAPVADFLLSSFEVPRRYAATER